MKALISFVAILALAVPSEAGNIRVLSPNDGDTFEVGSYVRIDGVASGTWPPAPSVTVQIFRDNGMEFENYGYCTAQLDLDTGGWTTGFSPEYTGKYLLTACLYQGTDLVASDSLFINVVNRPAKKE
jgi:hypothetical protein